MEGGAQEDEEVVHLQSVVELAAGTAREKATAAASPSAGGKHDAQPSLARVPSRCAVVWIKTRVDWSGLGWAKNQYRSCQMQFLGQQESSSTRGLEFARRGDSAGFHVVPPVPKRGLIEEFPAGNRGSGPRCHPYPRSDVLTKQAVAPTSPSILVEM
jgi:hypothetical protein